MVCCFDDAGLVANCLAVLYDLFCFVSLYDDSVQISRVLEIPVVLYASCIGYIHLSLKS